MDLKELRPNPENPRKVSKERLSMLRAALVEFGDLGAIIYNRKTKQIVGGHQRAKVFTEGEITLESKYKKPTRTGTVAEGYVLFEGERFKYREVSWDETKERAANLAANRGAGDWDKVKLSEWIEQIGDFGFDLDLTLFSADERKALKVVKTVAEPPTADDDDEPKVSGKKQTTCPDCGHRFTPGWS